MRTDHPGWSDEERAVLAAAAEVLPERYTLVAGLSVHGDLAWVVLAPEWEPLFSARHPNDIYEWLYDVGLARDGDGWIVWHTASGGGRGWSCTSGDGDLGVTYLADEAPPGAREAEVRFLGEVERVPVRGGFYCWTRWGVPCPGGELPWLANVSPPEGDAGVDTYVEVAPGDDEPAAWGTFVEIVLSDDEAAAHRAELEAMAQDDTQGGVLVRFVY
jgi:hypothetical protein